MPPARVVSRLPQLTAFPCSSCLVWQHVSCVRHPKFKARRRLVSRQVPATCHPALRYRRLVTRQVPATCHPTGTRGNLSPGRYRRLVTRQVPAATCHPTGTRGDLSPDRYRWARTDMARDDERAGNGEQS